MDESLSNWTIREAIKEFCFETRVEDINNCEHYFRPQQLVDFGYPNLGEASAAGEETPFHPHTSEEVRRALEVAWANALLDLKTRIERGDLNVSGVQVQPELRAQREAIPNQWAMEFDIDPLRSVITLGDRRYVNVLLELKDESNRITAANPVPPTSAPLPAAAWIKTLGPRDLPDLDDETVLALLEEHGRRVVEHGARLIQPSKISFKPIIRKKMQARAKAGEVLPTLAGEAEWLAGWIKERIEHHQLPSTETLIRNLRNDYAELKSAIHTGDQKIQSPKIRV